MHGINGLIEFPGFLYLNSAFPPAKQLGLPLPLSNTMLDSSAVKTHFEKVECSKWRTLLGFSKFSFSLATGFEIKILGFHNVPAILAAQASLCVRALWEP